MPLSKSFSLRRAKLSQRLLKCSSALSSSHLQASFYVRESEEVNTMRWHWKVMTKESRQHSYWKAEDSVVCPPWCRMESFFTFHCQKIKLSQHLHQRGTIALIFNAAHNQTKPSLLCLETGGYKGFRMMLFSLQQVSKNVSGAGGAGCGKKKLSSALFSNELTIKKIINTSGHFPPSKALKEMKLHSKWY